MIKTLLNCVLGALWFGLLGPFVGGLVAAFVFSSSSLTFEKFLINPLAGAPLTILIAYALAWFPAMLLGVFAGPFRKILASPFPSTVVGIAACALCSFMWLAIDTRSVYTAEQLFLYGWIPSFIASFLLSMMLGMGSKSSAKKDEQSVPE